MVEQPHTPTVFIIHGRDIDARDAVVQFIRSIGLEWLSFDDAAAGLGPAPFIGDIIKKGIDSANAAIALFTPDEQAALYSFTGERERSGEEDARWQARPNVIFEAGIAYGLKPDKTLLVTLGSDVRLFSNLGGRRFVELDQPGGRSLLLSHLTEVLGSLPLAQQEAADIDFTRLARRRWPFYDELSELEADMYGTDITEIAENTLSLLSIVRCVREAEPAYDWSRSTAKRFLSQINRIYDDNVAQDAYWWLVVFGFFRFRDIDRWWKLEKGDNAWNSVDYVQLSRRGVALMEKWKRLTLNL